MNEQCIRVLIINGSSANLLSIAVFSNEKQSLKIWFWTALTCFIYPTGLEQALVGVCEGYVSSALMQNV